MSLFSPPKPKVSNGISKSTASEMLAVGEKGFSNILIYNPDRLKPLPNGRFDLATIVSCRSWLDSLKGEDKRDVLDPPVPLSARDFERQDKERKVAKAASEIDRSSRIADGRLKVEQAPTPNIKTMTSAAKAAYIRDHGLENWKILCRSQSGEVRPEYLPQAPGTVVVDTAVEPSLPPTEIDLDEIKFNELDIAQRADLLTAVGPDKFRQVVRKSFGL